MSAPARRPPLNRRRDRQLWTRLLLAAGLIVLVVNGLFPLAWMALTSLKTEVELSSRPITVLPLAPTLGNYAEVFRAQPFATFFLNSSVVALASSLLCVLVAALAAYALARLRLRARRLYTVGIVAASMFPVVSLVVPLFKSMRALGLLNSYPALVLPYVALSLPVAILTLTAFFQGVPEDLENAAQVDGCSRLGALWRIVVPLAAPGVVTAGILVFVNSWNEFLLALTLTSSAARRTIPVGITLYQGEFAFPWPLISAAIVISVVPIVALVAVFQRRIVGGLTAGGVKG